MKMPEATLDVITTTVYSNVFGATSWKKEQGGLNEKLIAVIGLNDEKETGEEPKAVYALLEDGDFSLESQYSTPFENANPEGRLPNLMGMIQSGLMPSSINELIGLASGDGYTADKQSENGETKNGLAEKTINHLNELSNKTTFTKINSQQIFTSSNSVRITATLVFSAWEDAKKEVEDAIAILQSWTVPIELADNGVLINTVKSGFGGLFPSKIPPKVFLTYGGKRYSPLVIESLSAPLVAPMNKDGDRLAVKCQITLLSLQAWDRKDIRQLNGVID